MSERDVRLPLVGAVLGALAGYLIIHPFGVVVHALFHVQSGTGQLHLNWGGMPGALWASFALGHLFPALLHAALGGMVGYLFGRTLLAHRTIGEQLRRFAVIGENTTQILHDAKSPVAVISAYADKLRDAVKEPEHVGSCEAIARQAKAFMHQVREINLIAREDRRLELNKTPTDLAPFLESAVSEAQLPRKIPVESAYDGKVSIDRGYFERVVWNLICNADEALEAVKDGRIRIAVARADDQVEIRVIDNGPGIPRDLRSRLFILGATFGKRYGTGIGLYSCKRIVEAHGGRIWMSSGSGAGTTVHIGLPVLGPVASGVRAGKKSGPESARE
ncbi:ATP-binding protein [Elusimicrobiota bacterium]